MSFNQIYNMSKDINNSYSYDLKYLDARRTAFILNIIQKTSNEAVPFIHYSRNSTLCIITNKEDWKRLIKIITELDQPQPENCIIDIIDLTKFRESLK